jgi:hypothetical protein
MNAFNLGLPFEKEDACGFEHLGEKMPGSAVGIKMVESWSQWFCSLCQIRGSTNTACGSPGLCALFS